MDQIVGIVEWYVFPSITAGVCAERLMSQAFWGRPPVEANVTKALPTARICIKELERLKGSAEFMAGDAVSIADLMLVPHIAYFRHTPEGSALLQGTSLDAWLTRMSARPSMQATERERLKQVA
jgi:glutathione S-transferase